MPKLAVELSETKLQAHLRDARRTKRRTVALGGVRGLVVRLEAGKQPSINTYLTFRLEPGGALIWMPLGSYPDEFRHIEEIREEARRWVRVIKSGEDPRRVRERERAEAKAAEQAEIEKQRAAVEAEKNTVGRALRHYIGWLERNGKPTTATWGRQLIERILLPYWDRRELAQVGRKEVKEWHEGLLKSKEAAEAKTGYKSTADACLRLLSRAFSLAIDEEWCVSNPCFRMGKHQRGKEGKRSRTLDAGELHAVHCALKAAEGKEEPVALAAIRCLLLTTMRLQEVLGLRWDAVDLKRDLITLKDHKTSRLTGDKVIPVTPELRVVLQAQKKMAGCPYVFPAVRRRKDGARGHFVGLQQVWNRIRIAAGCPDVTHHDLRRTGLSITAGEQDIKLISAVAGHASVQTTEQHYAQVELEKKRKAAGLIATRITQAMKGEEP